MFWVLTPYWLYNLQILSPIHRLCRSISVFLKELSWYMMGIFTDTNDLLVSVYCLLITIMVQPKLAQYWGAFGFLALFPGHSWGKPPFLTGKVEVLEDTGAVELVEKGPIP